jgi:hypothetical protein
MTSGAKTDPELLKQLEATAATDTNQVEAVIRLKADDASQVVPTAERTEELANELLTRVGSEVGESVPRYNVFRNLGSFVVSAPPPFIRKLISQPEVAAATANRQPESAAMPPVEKSPTKTKTAKARSKKSTRKR